jgi:predicted nucleotide-binding protein
MVRERTPDPPQIQVRKFTLSDIDKGIAKLRNQIDQVRKLGSLNVSFDDSRVQNVEFNITETIREVFGDNSPEFKRYGNHDIWREVDVPPFEDGRQAMFAAGIPQTIHMLEGLIERLEEKREDAIKVPITPISPIAPMPGTRRVFIVHGRDETIKQTVARFLEKLHLHPVILHEEPSQGRTVIEKFEGHADVDFAVVLFTPDDVGYPNGEPMKTQSRARQNVIFELGYFIGRLGRSRVCVLYKGGVEILSDYEGVVYMSMDDPRDWRLLVAREIKASGIDIDLNLAI